jgi:hypothetical protein
MYIICIYQFSVRKHFKVANEQSAAIASSDRVCSLHFAMFISLSVSLYLTRFPHLLFFPDPSRITTSESLYKERNFKCNSLDFANVFCVGIVQMQSPKIWIWV